MLALYLAMAVDPQQPYWAVMTVYILMLAGYTAIIIGFGSVSQPGVDAQDPSAAE